jgi:hypothetical protein
VATQPTALQEAINQNTPGNSQLLPQGLPGDKGDYGTTTLTPAPSGFSSLTGWGVVYQEAGASVSPNAATDTVQIADFTTYVHLTNGSWVEVQNEAQGGIGGAHYVADFANNASIPLKQQTLSDGSVSMDAPPAGYNDHFFPTSRGTYTPGTVDGVFVEANMKTNDASANLVAQLGADWWRSPTAAYVNGFANNPAVGGDNFTKLTTQWQTLYYTSLSAAQLQADPPPGLATGSTSTTPPVTTPPVTTPPVTTPPVTTPPAVQPAVTQATASPGSGVEHVGTTVALTLDFNEAVTVTGKPTLTLNDGSTATYVSGSGTKALIFDTNVASANTATSALAVTAANLPSGASIKDASGVAANLSGAVTTFSGVQIDPAAATTPPVTIPPVTTPPVASDPTAPVLSVADSSLSVQGHGGTVGLGLSVKSSDSNDAVSVEIKGLPRYETITDKLDGHTFRGNDITLTAAEVDSGLTLHSYHWGSSQPVATLAATATAKDSTTGSVTTSATQTITVKDPPATSTVTSTSHANHSFALLNQYLAGGNGQVDHGQIAAATSHAASWLNESLLTRPQH